MKSAIDELVERANEHEAGFEGPHAGIPAEHVAIVTCMDARIDTFRIFGLACGDAHVLRNAGGLVTDDVLRSLVLSQRRLHTREVIVMQHTGCGVCGLDEAQLVREIEADSGEEPAYAFGSFDDVDAAVRRGVERIRDHPFLPHRDRVRGFVYDVETGRVREVST